MRYRLWKLRRALSFCRFYAIEVWPLEMPQFPDHKSVKTHSYGSDHLTPIGAWRAANEWRSSLDRLYEDIA